MRWCKRHSALKIALLGDKEQSQIRMLFGIPFPFALGNILILSQPIALAAIKHYRTKQQLIGSHSVSR
jgi:hypothetical protein